MTLFFEHRWLISTIFILGIITSYLLLKFAAIGDILQIFIGIVLLFGLLYSATKYELKQRNQMFALIILITTSIVFWGTFFQAFFSVNLFVERNVDRHLFGILIPPVAFISMEMFFIILLGAPLAYLWQKLNRSEKKPSISVKFGFAMLAMSAAMYLLVIAIKHPLQSGYIHAFWLVGFYLLLTIGEMLLSPIGLSMVTELAPSNLTGLMMGVWFLALGFGGSLAGTLATEADIPRHLTNLKDTNAIYQHAFFNYSMLALSMGILLFIATPWIKKLANRT